MQNKFFTFISPYLSFIDKGHIFRKPFSALYAIFAVINLIFPLTVFYQGISREIFNSEFKVAAAFILIWLFVAFAGWVGFQLWWDRMKKITTSSPEYAEFVATPVFAHLIQTLGEWLGTWIGIVGFGTSLITTLFLGSHVAHIMRLPFIDNLLGFGAITIFTIPLIGFLIIIVTRFLAEQFKALSAIANNTKRDNI